MPDDATNAAMINYAGQVASSSINAMATQKLNKKTMAYNDEWAYRQRQWALEDWDRQNAYNLPSAQRQRLIDAHINPALMYGKGAGDLTSGPIRAGSPPNWNPEVPKMEVSPMNSLSMYYDIKMKQAQVNQMNIQNQLLQEQTKLTGKKWWTEDVKQRLEGVRANLTDTEFNIASEKLRAIQQYQEETGGNFFKSQNDAQLSIQRSQARQNLTRAEIAEATKSTSIDQAFQNLTNSRLSAAKTEEEKNLIIENKKAVEKSNILQDLQIEFVKSGGKWAPYLLGLLGILGKVK